MWDGSGSIRDMPASLAVCAARIRLACLATIPGDFLRGSSPTRDRPPCGELRQRRVRRRSPWYVTGGGLLMRGMVAGLGTVLALVLLAGCGDDSSDQPEAVAEPETVTVERTVPAEEKEPAEEPPGGRACRARGRRGTRRWWHHRAECGREEPPACPRHHASGRAVCVAAFRAPNRDHWTRSTSQWLPMPRRQSQCVSSPEALCASFTLGGGDCLHGSGAAWPPCRRRRPPLPGDPRPSASWSSLSGRRVRQYPVHVPRCRCRVVPNAGAAGVVASAAKPDE